MNCLKPVFGVLLLLLSSSVISARTWTSSDGKSFEGDFVRLTDDNQVVVKAKDSEDIYTVPMDRFSGTDQTYVKNQVELAKKAARGEFDPDSADAPARKSTGGLKRIREWTSPNGDKRKAKFVRMHEGKVVLMAGNKGVAVEFSQFGKEDQEFLRTELEAIGKGDEVPKDNGNFNGEGYADNDFSGDGANMRPPGINAGNNPANASANLGGPPADMTGPPVGADGGYRPPTFGGGSPAGTTDPNEGYVPPTTYPSGPTGGSEGHSSPTDLTYNTPKKKSRPAGRDFSNNYMEQSMEEYKMCMQ